MVTLVDDFLGTSAVRTHSLTPRELGKGSSAARRPNEIDRAASEVERARDATHSAVALSSAAAGGNNEVRMSSPELVEMQLGMSIETPLSVAASRHDQTPRQTAVVSLSVATAPRLRWMSQALSTETSTTSL